MAEGLPFCPHCGVQSSQLLQASPIATPIFCRSCGRPMQKGASYCAECGANRDDQPQGVPLITALWGVVVTLVTLPFAIFGACLVGVVGTTPLGFVLNLFQVSGPAETIGAVVMVVVALAIFALLMRLWFQQIQKLFK